MMGVTQPSQSILNFGINSGFQLPGVRTQQTNNRNSHHPTQPSIARTSV
ncbi:hypothetical protein [Lyngbya aestuarii]|nr:hypothetical protein [Lyngbya aestuarii]